jgi:hypothetical protein
MRKVVGIGAAWLAATIVAVVVAAAAVGSVRGEVTDAPMALGASSIEVDVSAPTSDDPPSPVTLAPQEMPTTTIAQIDASAEPSTTTTAPAPVTTTTAASVTTTTTPAVTTTTVDSYTKTYDTEGGSVRINISGESVTFAGATPLPGWTVELENSGPEEVKVHFERNEDEEEEIKFTAKFDDGQLKVTISESDED